MKSFVTTIAALLILTMSTYGQDSSDPGRFLAGTDWDTIYVQKNPATNLYYADTVQFYEIYGEDEGSITIEFIDQFILEKNRDFLQVFDGLIEYETFLEDIDDNQVQRDTLIDNGTLRTPQKEGRGLDFENQLPDPITSNRTIPTGESNLLLRFSSFDDGNQNEGWTVRYRRNVGTPDLKVTQFSVDSITALERFDASQGLVALPGDDIQLSSQVSNLSYQSFEGGNALAGGSFIGYYFISEEIMDQPYETIIDDTRDDVYFLGEQTMPAISGAEEEQEPVLRRPTFSIPTDGVDPGTWYIVAIADHKNQINEGDDDVTTIDGLDNASFLSIEIPKLEITDLQDIQISTGPLQGDLDFSIQTNIQWTADIQGDWLNLDKQAGSKATTGETITIDWLSNDTDNPRIGTATFAGNPAYWYVDKVPTTTIVVTQDRPKLLLDKSFVNLDSDPGSFAIGVSTNLNFRILTNDGETNWLTTENEGSIRLYEGDQNVQIVFDYDARSVPIERTTSIEIQGILNDDNVNPQIVLRGVITVTQQGEPVVLNSSPINLAPLASEGDEVSIRINSNTNWIIEENAQWLSIDPLVGGSTNLTDVTITAKENPSPQERRTSVLIQSAGNEEFVVLEVTQEGADPVLDLNRGELDDTLEFEGNGNEENDGARIFLQTNLNWTITVLPTNVDDEPIFEDELGRPTNNVVPENQPVPPANWVELEHTEGGPTEDLSIDVEVLPNIHTDTRYAIILIEGESQDGSIELTDTLFIAQENGSELIFWGTNSIPITSATDSLDVKVVGDEFNRYEVLGLYLDGGTTNQVLEDQDSIISTSWIQFELKDPLSDNFPFIGEIGSNNFDEVKIVWDENSDNAGRSAIIIVQSRSAADVVDTLTLFQRPKVITLNVDKNVIDLGREAGMDSLLVFSSDISAIDIDDNMEVIYDGTATDWITIDSFDQSSGNLKFSFTENPDASERSAILLLEVSGNEERVRINQKGEDEFIDIDFQNFTFPAEGDSTGLLVQSNFDWNVSTLGGDWLEISKVFIDGDDIPDAVKLLIEPNETTASRVAEVEIGKLGLQVSFFISQVGQSIYFDLNPREVTLNAHDTLTYSAEVFTNIEWSLDIEDGAEFLTENGGWLSVEEDSVNNLVLIQAVANSSGFDRAAIIPVVGGGPDEEVRQDLFVTQKGLESDVVVITISSEFAQQNEIIDIPVLAGSGFESITSFQFTMKWDTSHLTFRSVSQFQLPGLGNSSFSTTQTNDGFLLVSWTDPNVFGNDMESGEQLFNLQFIVKRETQSRIEVDESAQALVPVEITRKIEENLVEVPSAFNDGLVISNSTAVDSHTVRGSIETPRGVEMSDVVVQVLDPDNTSTPIESAVSNQFGDYEVTFDVVDLPDFIIQPVSDNADISQGVSTLDILLVRQHILLKNLENSRQYAYQVIASDVDNSGNVSTIDILYLRQIILESDFTEMPNDGPSWKYISTATTITDFIDPFGDVEEPDLFGLADDNVTFIAIKVGDPSFDVLGVSTSSSRASQETLQLNAEKSEESDELLTLQLSADYPEKIIGLQFEIRFDPQILRFIELQSELLSSSNYQELDGGRIRVSWDDGTLDGISMNDFFGNLTFEKLDNSTVSEVYFNSEYSEAVDLQFEVVQVDENRVQFNNPNPLSVELEDSRFIYPNPTLDIVHFTFGDGERILEVVVFDNAGRIILRKEPNNMLNTVKVDLSEFDSGIYYYQVRTDAELVNGKILKH